MKRAKLLIKHAEQIVQVCANNEDMLVGEAMKNIAVMKPEEGTSGLSLVIDREGNIADFGTDAKLEAKYANWSFENVLDASGCCLLPGLVDAHTHPVWAGDRVHEFAMKLAGATYMEVHKAGGGINFTVEHTRNASEKELFVLFKERLQRMVKAGTTLVECKSGYGLDVENELKMLRVIERARRDDNINIEISSTYCGAHSVPKGSTADETTDDVISKQIPAIKAEMEMGKLHVDNIDVFCEKGVFDIMQTRRILEEGVKAGWRINFHGDELNPMKAAELGADMKACAISHLEEISDNGIAAMASARSVAVILPTTAYILRLRAPPVRKMIESGVPMALGSDFNPNAFCLSMPLVMHLACVNLRMSMPEAIAASTINAAASLGRSETHGSIEVGKRGNVLVIRAPKWEHLVYQLGGQNDIIAAVVCRGKIAHQN
ncbi:unnamed protein product [Clavelina lepadiformis]|uniref:Probable imidazolonepropionase n=1 Tax=Clavelina lepadiformis TaxID=159417 RepID=A0ABP0GB19_CLALP